jgi:hypothetical protein
MYLESKEIDVENLQAIGEYLELVLPDETLNSKTVVNLALDVLRGHLETRLVKAVLDREPSDMSGVEAIAKEMREFLEGLVTNAN